MWAVWDDPGVDWSRFELVVVRSAWDYAERWEQFLAWAAAVPRIENPFPVLRFGVDKERYLTALAAADVPVVPTAFVSPGESFEPPDRPFVVKPSISAGGRRSARFEGGDESARALVDEIRRVGQTPMVQPFLTGAAERSFVFVDGAYSHSLRRSAALPPVSPEEVLYLNEELGPYEASPEGCLVARAALRVAPEPTLYARVDLLGGLVLELELVEPSLYLSYGEAAADRVAAAIAARLGLPRGKAGR